MAAEVNKLLVQLGTGKVTREQAIAFFQALGLPTPLAESMSTPPPIPDPVVEPLVQDIQQTLSAIRQQHALLTA